MAKKKLVNWKIDSGNLDSLAKESKARGFRSVPALAKVLFAERYKDTEGCPVCKN